MKRTAVAAALTAALIEPALTVTARAQEPSLEDVVAQAANYLVAYQKELAGIVSEETYLQSWQRRVGRTPETRTLRSDVLLTRPQGVNRFLLFRDVFEVDGRQVRDRTERLTQLFLMPAASTSTQVLRIIEESARYNIGDIGRTVNTPTLALLFLDPEFQSRFRFSRSADRVPETVRAAEAADETSVARFKAPDEVWVVGYEEIGPNMLIGSGDGFGLPASGRYWIEPESGRLIMSELILRNAAIEAIIDVKYEEAPAVGQLVPAVMRERYRDLRRNNLIEGTATYSRVRRFQVTTSEVVAEPLR